MKRKQIKRTEQNVIVAVIILIAIIALGYYFGTVGVGKAIETPTDLYLDTLSSESINAETVPDNKFFFTPSGETEQQEYILSIEIDEENLVTYEIKDDSGSTLVKGLLDESTLSTTGDIYLDQEDLFPDIKLNYADGYMEIINLLYVVPQPAEFQLLTDGPDGKVEVSKDIMYFITGVENTYYIRVTSNSVPEDVTAYINSEHVDLIEEEPVLSVDGLEVSVDYTFVHAPSELGPYKLKLEILTEGGMSQKEYVVAVDGIVYRLDQEGYPKVILKKKSAEFFDLTYEFADTTKRQPFSLPCKSTVDIKEELDPEKIDKILTYDTDDESPKQWKEDIPSEINVLEANVGYAMKLKEGSGGYEFSINCQEELGEFAPPAPSILYGLPDLKEGWNLIGVSGYDLVSMEAMALQTSSVFKHITAVYVLDDSADILTFDDFEPGKAYWVYVE